MFTLVGYYDAVAHPTLAPVTAIPDPHVRVSGNDIYVPEWNKILGVLASGDDMTECRLQSPSLRRLANQRVTPVGNYALPLTIASQYVNEGGTATYTIYSKDVDPDVYFNNLLERPRTLDIAEALNAYAVNGSATAEWILVWLFDTIEALPPGEIISVEATSSVTLVVGEWVNGALTFTQTLPAGRYAVVGMRAQHSNLVAARFVFVGLPHRPGVLGVAGPGYPEIPLFRFGHLGNWGEFEHDSPPTVDFLGSTAGSVTLDVYLDLIQVRAGRA